MPQVVGGPPRFIQSQSFSVEIEQVPTAKFTTCNIPKQSAEAVIQRQGGSLLPVDIATGNITIDKITLGRGKTDNPDLWNWWLNVKAGIQDQRLVTIVEQATDGTPVTRWPARLCALVSYEGGAFDANKSENLVESIELQPIDVDRQAA